ncbi:MAG: hypothetical protein QM765_45595 [Myxococcales bacterium]
MRTLVRAALVVVVATVVGIAPPARACTAFADGPLLAKGFDWMTGEGWIVVNERGRIRSPLFPDSAGDGAWTAQYASVALTTLGPGFPVSGMNEKGLAIESLVDLDVSAVVQPVPGRLIGLELLQYGLDRFATAAELADFAEKARFTQLAVALHFFACDAGGDCVVIEPGRDSTRVVRRLPAKVLANEPYREDWGANHPSGLAALLPRIGPSRGSSAWRFQAVASAVKAAPLRDEKAALATLEKVVMPGRTQWQIVWNLKERTLTLRQREAGLGTLSLKLDELVAECGPSPRARSIGRSAHASFTSWSELDAELTKQAIFRQLGHGGVVVQRLAAVVAEATQRPGCARPEVGQRSSLP